MFMKNSVKLARNGVKESVSEEKMKICRKRILCLKNKESEKSADVPVS